MPITKWSNYIGRVFQDGMLVATVEGKTKRWVAREVAHYCLMYSEDGPVKGEIVRKRAKRKLRRKTK